MAGQKGGDDPHDVLKGQRIAEHDPTGEIPVCTGGGCSRRAWPGIRESLPRAPGRGTQVQTPSYRCQCDLHNTFLPSTSDFARGQPQASWGSWDGSKVRTRGRPPPPLLGLSCKPGTLAPPFWDSQFIRAPPVTSQPVLIVITGVCTFQKLD